MKVLHINNNYIETSLHQTMIEGLDKVGIENIVFASTYDKNVSIIKPNNNVIVSECYKVIDRYWFEHKQRKIYNSIENNVDVSKFDCIHAYTLFTDGNNARLLSQKYNIPYFVAVRNTDMNLFLKYMPHMRKLGLKIFKDAKAIFFLSSSYKKNVFQKYVPLELHSELLEKTFIIPNGLDQYWFDNLFTHKKSKPNKNNINLIFVGRINRDKNIMSIQKAINLLKKKNYHCQLTIVGKVEDRRLYKKLIKDNNTRYISQKNKNELIDLYRQNDIFVMASHHEAFGLVYLEAITQGLPVIYTKGQGFDKQFLDGEVGYPVNSRSPKSISESILKIIEYYDTITCNLANKCSKYDWNRICNDYYNIYKS